MGYSCTVRAHDVLRRTLNSINGENVNNYAFSNTWTYNGNTFFYERGKENSDGSITGSIFLMLDNGHCRRYGNLKIEANGLVTRWPGMPKSFYLPQTILA